MSEKLRECPFCENKDVILSDYSLVGNATCWRITCLHCRLVMSGVNKQLLINLWNTRPAEDALKAEVGGLTQALESIAKNSEFWDDEDDSLAVIYRICKRALSDHPDTGKGGEDE